MYYSVFIIGTIILILFSWFYTIRHNRYHGIPRFFSFESILILLMMNLKVWFHDPFSFFQIVSWILLSLSAYFAIAGFLLLKKLGKSGGNFENTTILVKSGLYSYIRHPLYFSLFLLGTGVVFKNPEFLQMILGIINFVAIYFTARIEEKEMISKFGNDYSEYMKETKMFVPFVV